jgi:hypothetical protein
MCLLVRHASHDPEFGIHFDRLTQALVGRVEERQAAILGPESSDTPGDVRILADPSPPSCSTPMCAGWRTAIRPGMSSSSPGSRLRSGPESITGEASRPDCRPGGAPP